MSIIVSDEYGDLTDIGSAIELLSQEQAISVLEKLASRIKQLEAGRERQARKRTIADLSEVIAQFQDGIHGALCEIRSEAQEASQIFESIENDGRPELVAPSKWRTHYLYIVSSCLQSINSKVDEMFGFLSKIRMENLKTGKEGNTVPAGPGITGNSIQEDRHDGA